MDTSKVNTKVRVQRTCAMLAATGITFTGITLISLLPAMAHAADAGGPVVQLTVRFADLNLSNQAGAKVLYRRIQQAAYQVCGSVDSKELLQAAKARACEDQAVSRAVTAIHNPLLSHEYFSKTGHIEKPRAIAAVR